jgi:hypothetical protein
MENIKKTMVTQNNHIQSVSNDKKNHLIEMIEKRYGIRIAKGVFVCEDRMNGVLGLPDSFIFKYRVIPPDIVLDSLISTSIISNIEISSLNDIYQLTNAGFNAKAHPINQNKKDGEKLTSLIPVVLIHCNKIAYFFRLDNVIIRQLFSDTKSVIDGIKECKNESLKKRFLEQKEYLNYCYSTLKSDLSLELWLNINAEKSSAGKGNMLHSEYLEWKRNEMNLHKENK